MVSDFDPDTGRRTPDNDELAEAYDERRRKLANRCGCIGIDFPHGVCPGRQNCPMFASAGEEEETWTHRY